MSTSEWARTLSLSVTPTGRPTAALSLPRPLLAQAGQGLPAQSTWWGGGVRAAPPPVVRLTRSKAGDTQAAPPPPPTVDPTLAPVRLSRGTEGYRPQPGWQRGPPARVLAAQGSHTPRCQPWRPGPAPPLPGGDQGTRNVAADSVPRGHGFLSQWARAEDGFPPFGPCQLQGTGRAQALPARPQGRLGGGQGGISLPGSPRL